FLSVLSVIILVSTTRFSNLLKGLEGLKLPTLLVSMISFVYRYLFIIADEYGHIKIARESRNFGGSKRWQWKAIGHSVGTLFLHSYERGDRVYSAMVARGYEGNIRTLGVQKIRSMDIIFVAISIVYLLLAGLISWKLL
ncbi:MAG: energy-coupling factor transporter transmembrane component T, partial [Deltaproteobacteria bacterium]